MLGRIVGVEYGQTHLNGKYKYLLRQDSVELDHFRSFTHFLKELK
jgi:hypothetical protein